MWAQVQVLRRQGARLKDGEVAAPIVGELTIAFQDSTRAGRPPIRVANLKAPPTGLQAFRLGLLVPLFDARMLSLEGEVLRITGVELSGGVGQPVSEHVQIWRCRLMGTAPPSSGADAQTRS